MTSGKTEFQFILMTFIGRETCSLSKDYTFPDNPILLSSSKLKRLLSGRSETLEKAQVNESVRVPYRTMGNLTFWLEF